jgi:hypothetical protein
LTLSLVAVSSHFNLRLPQSTEYIPEDFGEDTRKFAGRFLVDIDVGDEAGI